MLRHQDRILRLKEDFIRLHAEYKSCCADETNSTVQHDGQRREEEDDMKQEACCQKLSAIVDRMLEIMLQIIDLSTRCDNEGGSKSSEPQSDSADAKRRSGRLTKTVPKLVQNLEDDTYSQSDAQNERLVPFATSLGRCLIPVDVMDDLSQSVTPHWTRPGPKSKTRPASNQTTLSSLLSPEVRIDWLPSSYSSTIVKEELQSDTEEGFQHNDSLASDSSSSGSDSDESKSGNYSRSGSDTDEEEVKPRKQPTRRRGPRPPGSAAKSKLLKAARQQQWSEQCAQFHSLTDQWMYHNRPAPPSTADGKLSIRRLTPDQKRDIVDFHTQHTGHFHSRLIWGRLQEKYHLSLKMIRFLIGKARAGHSFDAKYKYRKANKEAFQEVVQEMVAYCRANPISFTCQQLATKYGWCRSTVSQTLRDHGIRVFNLEEKRAMRLNMEGKQYVPFYRTPEEAKYHKLRDRERKKRRATGDLTDGRRARHKDPTWRNLRQEIGVPDEVRLYAKEERQEKDRKKAVLSRLPPEERVILESSLLSTNGIKRDEQMTGKTPPTGSNATTRSRKAANKSSHQPEPDGGGLQTTTNRAESESTRPTEQPQHLQSSPSSGSHAGWSLQFDTQSGTLFNHHLQSHPAHDLSFTDCHAQHYYN